MKYTVKVLHESISCFINVLKLYFMKCSEKNISQCILAFKSLNLSIFIGNQFYCVMIYLKIGRDFLGKMICDLNIFYILSSF